MYESSHIACVDKFRTNRNREKRNSNKLNFLDLHTLTEILYMIFTYVCRWVNLHIHTSTCWQYILLNNLSHLAYHRISNILDINFSLTLSLSLSLSHLSLSLSLSTVCQHVYTLTHMLYI